MSVHILGIRHHGPGSARNVRAFLETVQPDIVLVEGPPEADGILEWATHAEIKPPVAILCFQPDDPKQSSFYPFAEFSPEWQAIRYAREKNIHVRFMDLPIAHRFALEKEPDQEPENTSSLNNAFIHNSEITEETAEQEDVIGHLAAAAGYDDGEKWWEHMFEHRRDNREVFAAVLEAMRTLREAHPGKNSRIEQLREAHMRKTIRQAEREMFQNIAVICGAWHAPALADMPKQKDDNELLKGLQKVKVECTWVPWTYNRLSLFSGYGAGITSPGWYHHIWNYPADDGTQWLVGVANLFRKKEMDTSVAHVIEATRLANALASLRNLSKAGLEELNEATLSVICNGEPILLKLVFEQLIVSNRIGEVPTEIPKPPLQLDIEKTQKRLRMPASADWKDYTLDLRKENDLERSIFLHRLQLLGLKWGERSDVSGKGTFKEQWRLQWDPAFSIDLIEKGSWGNTAAEAATRYVVHQASQADSLPVIGELLTGAIPAEIPEAIEVLILRMNNVAVASADVMQLMETVPQLVNVSRYGNVRKTDADLVTGIAESMIIRICVNLPQACMGVNEEAAAQLLEVFPKLNEAVNLLSKADLTAEWEQTLKLITSNHNTSPIIAGYSTRALSDRQILTSEDLVKAFYYAMSAASAPSIAAAWLEGFLTGSGTILLLDDNLWQVVNSWIEQLMDEEFIQVLPLVRRTFANFTAPERRKLGEKAKKGGQPGITTTEKQADEHRAKQGIPVVLALLGIQQNPDHE